jgi:hypothetical protein
VPSLICAAISSSAAWAADTSPCVARGAARGQRHHRCPGAAPNNRLAITVIPPPLPLFAVGLGAIPCHPEPSPNCMPTQPLRPGGLAGTAAACRHTGAPRSLAFSLLSRPAAASCQAHAAAPTDAASTPPPPLPQPAACPPPRPQPPRLAAPPVRLARAFASRAAARSSAAAPGRSREGSGALL